MIDALPRGDVHVHVVAQALRRFGYAIVGVTVLFAALAGAYAHLATHKYRSTAAVLVRPLAGNALSTQTLATSQSTTVAMETEASLATSAAVTQGAAKLLRTTLPHSAPPVTTSVPVNSQIVKITYTASTARTAQQRAQAYADAFLAYRSSLAAQNAKSLVNQLDARIATVQKQLQKALGAANKSSGTSDASTQVRLYTSTLSSLQSQVGDAQSTSTDPGNVITPASRPGAPSGLAPALIIAIGALVGLLLATAVAVWRERVDDRIRAGSEPTLLGLPVLAVLPNSRRRRAKSNTAAIRAEALRKARTSLLALSARHSVIAVAGVARGDLTLSPAAGLANAIAAAGYSVTLIDAADAAESRPSWLQGDDGLTNILDAPWSGHVPSHTVDGVRVVSAGSDPGTASDLYAGQVMDALLRHLQETSDFVLVAAPTADTAEGMAVILAAGQVVLVGTDRQTSHHQVEASVNIAESLDATVLGLLVQQPASGPSRGRNRRAEAGEPTLEPEKSRPSAGRDNDWTLARLTRTSSATDDDPGVDVFSEQGPSDADTAADARAESPDAEQQTDDVLPTDGTADTVPLAGEGAADRHLSDSFDARFAGPAESPAGATSTAQDELAQPGADGDSDAQPPANGTPPRGRASAAIDHAAAPPKRAQRQRVRNRRST